MDDSDQDFVDICSKFLKRARKKAAEPSRQTKNPEQALSQVQGDKRGNNGQGGDSGRQVAASQPVGKAEQDEVHGGTRFDPGEPSALHSDHGAQSDRDLSAKDKVLLKMQHFKRVSPQKMVHSIHVHPTEQDTCALTARHQIQGRPVVYQYVFNILGSHFTKKLQRVKSPQSVSSKVSRSETFL